MTPPEHVKGYTDHEGQMHYQAIIVANARQQAERAGCTVVVIQSNEGEERLRVML